MPSILIQHSVHKNLGILQGVETVLLANEPTPIFYNPFSQELGKAWLDIVVVYDKTGIQET